MSEVWYGVKRRNGLWFLYYTTCSECAAKKAEELKQKNPSDEFHVVMFLEKPKAVRWINSV